MSRPDSAAARFARGWVHAVTRTADPEAARDRRDEIASDVHEQLEEASQQGVLSAGSRSVVSRVVRGMPADLIWRIGLEARPGRLDWHLRNPSTALTSAFAVMVPVNLVADSAYPGGRGAVDYSIPLWIATDALGLALIAFALGAFLVRVRGEGNGGAERYVPASRAERVRRATTAFLAVSWAGSAVFRFGVVSPIGNVSFGLFVLGLLAYLALLIGALIFGLLRLGRYLPKVVA
jgi:hypothetical protein